MSALALFQNPCKEVKEIRRLAIRWTIGDVSEAGFHALALSVRSAKKLFGPASVYAINVNSLALSAAKERLGNLAEEVQWFDATHQVPGWLWKRLDHGMAEGVAWKLAPPRLFPDLYELSLDNDLILWEIPEAVHAWLQSDDPECCVMAEDVQRGVGQFSNHCDTRAINSGIRGVSPGFDLKGRLRRTLEETSIILRSELDEQGLQAAALSRGDLRLVSLDDVSICSPFPMHQNVLGRCGVHFVGLNQKTLPWQIDGRGAHELIHERWRNFQRELNQFINEIRAA